MKNKTIAVLALASGLALPAWAQGTLPAAEAASRGRALYDTHCIACHNSKMHWRDQKVATDWPSLKAQVDRWQQREMLGWSDADVVEVARYLNDTIYRYPRSDDKVGRKSGPTSGRVLPLRAALPPSDAKEPT